MFKFCIFCSFILINNIANAEILHSYNEFANVKLIYSYFEKGTNENSPKEIVFKKQISSTPIYTLFISKRYDPARRYIALEDVKLKLNNDINKVYSINSRISETAVGSTYSLDLTPLIKHLSIADSIVFQIPSYTKEKEQIRYTYYELDKTILDEWKQVIAME